MTYVTDLATQLLAAARSNGLMIATVESCTGGLVAAALTDIPGSSDVFERGLVTYSNAAKSELLGVPTATIEAHGAVSRDTALAMATGALNTTPADLAIAVTGIAGPGGSDHKPEGLVWFATALRGHETIATEHRFGALGRATVRARSTETALTLGIARLTD